ncbi:UNVERIFIED_CONTAM: hypothetical protein HDU68_003673 [Siphonaria sp. JEL0065]|nr:hypothetical protein HDU68_003673 [Siphonaria sp. JEL0065]
MDLKQVPTVCTKKEFLLEHPRGAYTATRTLNCSKVMNWTLHLNRLVSSWTALDWSNSLGQYDPQAQYRPALNPTIVCSNEIAAFKAWNLEILKETITNALITAIAEYYSYTGALPKDGITNEATITILLLQPDENNNNNTVQLLIHLEHQLDHTFFPCVVALYGAPRILPSVKDSQWSRDRRPLELRLAPPVSELLLIDHYNNIYEGLTSNFFCIIQENNNFVVLTAPQEFVLNGTILKNVQAACVSVGISFRFEFPNVEGVGGWVGAFVTS